MKTLIQTFIVALCISLSVFILVPNCTKALPESMVSPFTLEKSDGTTSVDSVALYSFTAYNESDGLLLVWETGTEENVNGYHIWRSEQADSPFVRLTAEWISSGTKVYSYQDRQVIDHQNYCYRLEAVFIQGNSMIFESNTACAVADIVDLNPPPQTTMLYPNYPNPFSDRTVVRFALSERAIVNLVIRSSGQKPGIILMNQLCEAGIHELLFDGSGFSEGMYVCELRAGKAEDSILMLLVRD
jgi:hypothetical protein